ncbi:ScpA family protein [Ruminococcus sp. HUN007]|jgi:segregation and condensation protein A|uniref:segregation and condensation protein A n=1 Tax=Ruminococcus sp. HUN007 TaxID=1514668 RepID=UPI0005D2B60E|nr:ScpA family protein [Ruminococcus sp. HUN007]
MEKLSFKLEIFEGPLDLLLHLVIKHKLDINDIEISKLLEQYLLYLDQCAEHDLELAGEFLEMAARLIYIKTLALLPAPEEEEEEKKALQGALIEYALCKKAAAALAELYCGGDMFVRKQAVIKAESDYQRVHEATVLRDAFLGMHVKKIPVRDQGPDERFRVIVKHKMYSVTTKVISILKQLYKTGTADMEGLYDGVTDRSERVATFLAVLELTKSGRIYISDDNTTITFIGKRKERKSS